MRRFFWSWATDAVPVSTPQATVREVILEKLVLVDARCETLRLGTPCPGLCENSGSEESFIIDAGCEAEVWSWIDDDSPSSTPQAKRNGALSQYGTANLWKPEIGKVAALCSHTHRQVAISCLGGTFGSVNGPARELTPP